LNLLSNKGAGGFERRWRGFQHRSGRTSFFPGDVFLSQIFPEKFFSALRTKNSANFREESP